MSGRPLEPWKQNEVKRIAVVRALFLGDMLLATPALRALRGGYPDAEITLIGQPWAERLMLGLGSIDRFLTFPGYRGIPELAFEPMRTEAFLAEARSYEYDLAIQLHGDGRVMNRFVAELGARDSLGYALQPDSAPLTMPVPYPGDDAHEALKFGDLLHRIGIAPHDYRLEFPVGEADGHELNLVLADLPRKGSGPLVAIHPGASAPARRWPAERFGALAHRLWAEHGVEVLILGGAAEATLGEAIEQRMRAPAMNLMGRTSLGVLGAAIARADLFICNDSGPAHIAYAVGTPSITLFGPGNVSRWAPLNSGRHLVLHKAVECSPCAHQECPIDHRCMERIGVDEVAAAAGSLLPTLARSPGL